MLLSYSQRLIPNWTNITLPSDLRPHGTVPSIANTSPQRSSHKPPLLASATASKLHGVILSSGRYHTTTNPANSARHRVQLPILTLEQEPYSYVYINTAFLMLCLDICVYVNAMWAPSGHREVSAEQAMIAASTPRHHLRLAAALTGPLESNQAEDMPSAPQFPSMNPACINTPSLRTFLPVPTSLCVGQWATSVA